eukprot:5844549-Alexandrium_andersonii.AAC.1
MCIRDRSQLARRAKWPFPRLGSCRNSEPHSPEEGAASATLHAAHPSLGSASWGAPNFRRFRAAEKAVWPVGRAGTATSRAEF